MISRQGENLVFLLGVPRSGTTLLSVMLDGHSQLRCPPEPWLMLALESMGRTSARSPADAPVLYRALKEFCDPATAITAARQYATVIYNQSLAGTGKKILVDKTPRYYLILPYLTEVFPRAKFVILWRNPLDIAASIRATWQVDIASQLAAGEDHLNCIDLVVGLRRLLDFSKEHHDRVHTVKYERLVRQPQKTFNALLKWLDLPRELLGSFELAGSEFDRGDIGDKKILSTRVPHKDSIDRWKQTFNAGEIATVVDCVGPHLFAALGYTDLPNKSASDPARSNAYAQRLEQSLARRNSEYESVASFCDLTTLERRLHKALLDSTHAPGQPVLDDLATEIRRASESAKAVSATLARQLARIGELEHEQAAITARMFEARHLASTQSDQANARDADRASQLAAQARQIEVGQSQISDLRDQLKNAQLQLERTATDHSAQCLALASITQQLDQARIEQHSTIGDLLGHRQQVMKLSQELQEVQTGLQRTSDELETRRAQAIELTTNLRLTSEANATQHQHVLELSTQLVEAQKTIARIQRPPANRRPWPYAIPDSLPLPATLPGGKPWPKISIVTPSFNQGPFIEQTILSIVGQNYPNLEFILIDGGSTDETLSIIDRYRDRIDYIISEKDSGQSNAINKGFARATGELFTWINSDDMLESGALAAMAMAFHSSGADMVAGICTLHTGGLVASRHLTSCASATLPLGDLLDLEHCWLKGQFFYQPEVMFTRDLWLRAGGQLDEGLYYSMDYDLWLRFAEQEARLHVIGRPIALYRIHDRQKTFKIADYKPELSKVRHRFMQRANVNADRNGHSKNGHNAGERTHLRVLFFNDLGNVGGAGIAHQRLAAAMATAGHEVIPLAICPHLTRCQLSNDAILQAIADRTPDIVFLGNIHSAQLDPVIIGLISNRWPTLQVLHDLYSLTGRCAYTGDCEKFITGCDDACPTADQYPALDSVQISTAWQIKNDAITGENPPILAAVSDWTENFARGRFGESEKTTSRSLVYAEVSTSPAHRRASEAGVLLELPQRKPPIVGIRYGLSTDVFRPRDKSTCRNMLDLPQDRFIILFSSTTLADERKGLLHLIAALESLEFPDLLAVCIGQQDANLATVGFEIRSMGYIADVNSLATLYSAADIFVGPSLVETFGQVFIEAAACGTPSVGYATAGGVADAIADGVSGLLAPAQTPEELARLIRVLHDSPALRRDMGAWGRLWAENQFSLHSAYQRIFAQLSKIGLLKKLHIAPNVSFYPNYNRPVEITYLDVPPPPPTAAELLSLADNQIALLQTERDSILASSTAKISQLQSDTDQLRIENETQITNLKAERDAIQTRTLSQIARMETDKDRLQIERDSLQAARDSLQTERDSLRVSIRNITQTRLWRMVGAVYPIYQWILFSTRIPQQAKRPIEAIHRRLSQPDKKD